MQDTNKFKTILVPVDDSRQSFETVRYIGKILEPKKIKITLFHVISPVSKSFEDYQIDPPVEQTIVLNKTRKERIENFVEKEAAALHQQGVYPENIKLVIQPRERGIARDILSEALRGYDAIAMGRWRYKAMKNQIMGGTANKIVHNLYNIPVWLLGEWSDPGKILIAMDGSAGAMRAFTYAQKMLLLESTEILLYSVIRNFDDLTGEAARKVSTPEETKWRKLAAAKLEKTEEEMKCRFAECINHLKQTGGDSIRVKSKIKKGLPSRAEGILAEARQGGYGTIIVGRRGLSDIRQYAMGQVCQKILTMATDRAVWIVN